MATLFPPKFTRYTLKKSKKRRYSIFLLKPYFRETGDGLKSGVPNLIDTRVRQIWHCFFCIGGDFLVWIGMFGHGASPATG